MVYKSWRRVNIIVGANVNVIRRRWFARLNCFLGMIQTWSSRSCRILKDSDRSRVSRQVHAVNSALHAARDRATRAKEAQTTRSLRARLLCRIRCMLVQTALLTTHRGTPSEIRISTPFKQSMKSLQMHFCPNVHFGKKDAQVKSLKHPLFLDGVICCLITGLYDKWRVLKQQIIRFFFYTDQGHHHLCLQAVSKYIKTLQLAHINCCILLLAIRWLSSLVFPLNSVPGVTLLDRASTHQREFTHTETWKWTFHAP